MKQVTATPILRAPRTAPLVMLAGIGLASFASLLLELAWTRLFSVVLFYHFAFLAISIALLGLGAGGVFAYLRAEWLARWSLRQLGCALCAINCVVILLALEVVLHVPVSLGLGWANFGRLTISYVAAALPFFVTGVLFSSLFARETARISQLYGADLVGGALSCLALVPLLNWLGGPNAVVFAALAMAGAAVVWADIPARKRTSVILVAVLLLLAANYSGRLIDVVYAKGVRRDQPWMLFARWNALSRVEVDQVRGAKYIVIDADASTAIMNTDPAKWDQTPTPMSGGGAAYNWKQDLMSAAPAIANILRPEGTYAIIGPGGGVDILRAVANGSPGVTGIEINPLIANTIMRRRYADYSYHLYELPQVHIHVGDGRSWVRGSSDRFDVLEMTLVDTWASTAAGAFALSENNLYTVEAFREYFDHLKPDGFIAITRWEFRRPREALRVVTQAIAALERMGVTDVRRHFIVVSDGALDEDGRPVTVLAKKTPFTWVEERRVLDHVRQNPNLYPLYTPLVYSRAGEMEEAGQPACGNSGAHPICDPEMLALWRSRQAAPEAIAPFDRLVSLRTHTDVPDENFSPRGEFIRNYPFNISAVSDNAPFFFFTFKTRDAVRHVLEGAGRGMDWKNNLGVVVLGIVLVISCAAVLAFLIGPLAVHGGGRQHLAPMLYFVALGLGYILAEIALLQRFVLFLGHPTYALTIVVFLMLLTSGLGSVLSRRLLLWPVQVRYVLAAIALVVVAYILLLPRMLPALVGLPLAIKLGVSGLLLAPAGFIMGMPFPSGLRQIGGTADQRVVRTAVEWAWAMNAASSVLGSVLAMVIALHMGLNAVLGAAAGAYLGAMLLTLKWQAQSC